jgi:bifunctional non-homologous end joining protein LigD
MLATLGPLPTAPGWGYELKWDGVRAIVYLDRGASRLMSRNDRDMAVSYPEVGGLAKVLSRERLILDGEIVALGPDGAPSFSLLQQRMHVATPSTGLLARVPVRLYVFDVLHHGDRSLLELGYAQRRQRVDELALDRADVAAVPPYWTGSGGQAGDDVMQTAREQGLEGVVAKRLDSPYQPGRRALSWVKTPLNQTQEVLICGWKPGRRAARRHAWFPAAGRLRHGRRPGVPGRGRHRVHRSDARRPARPPAATAPGRLSLQASRATGRSTGSSMGAAQPGR